MALPLRGLAILCSSAGGLPLPTPILPALQRLSSSVSQRKAFRPLTDTGVPSLNSVFRSHIGKAISKLRQALNLDGRRLLFLAVFMTSGVKLVSWSHSALLCSCSARTVLSCSAGVVALRTVL